MKAAVYTKYGPPEVLKIREVAKPVPGEREVLIKIHAATVTVEDPKMRSGRFELSPLLEFLARIVIGSRRPRHTILGFEFSGVIEDLGKQVQRFQVGDAVYGYTGLSFGAYAEYKCMPEDGVLAAKPENLSFEEAATLPNAALTSLVYLYKKGKLAKGEKVLINGASGSVGTAAVQLAKALGAEVTGVASTSKLKLVSSLGADYVLDYTKEDFTQSGERYDIIFDVASQRTFSQCKGSLTSNGRYLRTEFGVQEMLAMFWTSFFRGQKVIVASSNFSWTADDLVFLRGMVDSGKLHAVVDRCFPLTQVVEAHRYLERGCKQGNVVLTIHENT